MNNSLFLEYESEPEASEFDLGKKIKAPRDIMLEELMLQKNKGSKMFRMRQLRVERFIYENNPDLFSSESMVRILPVRATVHLSISLCVFVLCIFSRYLYS